MCTLKVGLTDVFFTFIRIDEPILSFQRNAFLPLRDERKLLKDYPKAVDLLYHEVSERETLCYVVHLREARKEYEGRGRGERERCTH